jgi:hypothetical protein
MNQHNKSNDPINTPNTPLNFMTTRPKKKKRIRKTFPGASAGGKATPPHPGDAAPTQSDAVIKTTSDHRTAMLIPHAFQEVAEEFQSAVGKFVALPVHELVEPIANFVTRERQCAIQAGRLSATSRLNRWATGRLLIAAKKSLRHGTFEAWLEEHRLKLGFSKSTAENYMKLARKYETAEQFMMEDAPLREMYERGKVLEDEEFETSDKPKAGKDKFAGPSKAECLMSCLTSLQKRMRHLMESGEQLEPNQVRQLTLVKDEIDRFFNQIITKNSTNL